MNVEQARPGNTEQPYRVLVLDDEENIRQLMRIFLEKAGVRVDTATNGREGLQCLLRNHYDVAVTDYRMAEMDGLTFVEEAKAIWPRLSVVLMSCFLEDKVVERARQLGVTRILSKPVMNKEFVSTVMAEAAENRLRNAVETGDSLTEVQKQLQILRQITQSALASQNVFDAMTELAMGLQEILKCEIVAVLGLENSGGHLLIHMENPQCSASVKQIQLEVLRRCQALSGMSISRSELHIQVDGPLHEESGDSEILHITSVPVIANNNVLGLVSLAFTHPAAVSANAITFLYHAANHFSTVLQAVGQIRKLAIYDPLTGAYNRLYMEQELERIWLLATRYDHVMAAMILDVDYFKSVNDKMGHGVGDEVLAEFARELRTMTRASDLLVRMGGDEFLLVLPKTHFLEAEELARRIVMHMRHHVFLMDKRNVRLTTTIGLALSQPGGKIFSHQQLVEKADEALYWAKRRGRDQMAVWSEEEEKPEPIPAFSHSALTVKASGQSHPEEIRALLLEEEVPGLETFLSILQAKGVKLQGVKTLEECREAIQRSAGKFHLFFSVLQEETSGMDSGQGPGDLANLDPRLVHIVLSADLTAERALNALRQGAYDFLNLNSPPTEVASILDRALKFRSLLNENYEYRHFLESMVRIKSQEVIQSLEELRNAYEFTLETMVNMLDAREYETSLHSKRVTILTRLLADYMGIQEPQLSEIARGAMLHDIGKIAIPDTILQKPGALTDEERNVMRTHPDVGFRFVKSSPFLKTSAEIVYHHHEAFDGSGYPLGLKGEAIPLGARIFSLIDSYDAMRSPRVYKSSFSKRHALEEIRRQTGRQFDPAVVERFLEVVDRLEEEAQWPAGLEDSYPHDLKDAPLPCGAGGGT